MLKSDQIIEMVKIIKKYQIVIFFTFLSLSSFSVGQHRGELTKHNFSVAGCNIHSMTVKFYISHLMGEVIVKGTFKWRAGFQTNNNCLPYDFHIWLKISDNLGNYGYIELSNAIPKAGKGFGFDAAGSPNWNEFIFNIKSKNKKSYYPAEKAKELYQNGKISDFTFSNTMKQVQTNIPLPGNSVKNKDAKDLRNIVE